LDAVLTPLSLTWAESRLFGGPFSPGGCWLGWRSRTGANSPDDQALKSAHLGLDFMLAAQEERRIVGLGMKRLVLTGVAAFALAVGGFGQGVINLDNSVTLYGVQANGSFYNGTYGMEVWELSPPSSGSALATLLSGINSAASGIAGYKVMVGDGFKMENATGQFAGLTMGGGTFSLGNLTMLDVTPAGGNVVLGLAVWNTSATSWAAMLGSANANTRAGVIAFASPTVSPVTADSLGGPIGVDLNASWSALGLNLVMTAIPEPGTLALAVLGVAMLLTFRRGK
jgi:hypothetical protein